LIDHLRHFLDPGGIIIGIDGNQLLRQLVEDIKVLLVLVQFRVKGLLRESEMKVNTRNVKYEGPSYLLLLLLGLQDVRCGGNGSHSLGPLLHAGQPLLELQALGLEPAVNLRR